MRSLLFVLALSLSAHVAADELSDANRALAARSYPEALQQFTKLAKAGNAEAQLRLGEMYWYGEGVALDRARGDALFAQAAAGGNQEAVAAQALSARRARQAADIAYWTGGYDGADMTAGKYQCAAPAIPAVSRTNADIKATNAAIGAWQACHNGFADNLNSALPPGKRIPPDIAVVMSEQETQQAKAHLDKVYGGIMDRVQAGATAIMAQRAKWEAATLASAEEQNRATEVLVRQAKVELENSERVRREAMVNNNRAGPGFRTK